MLRITVPTTELWDEARQEFITIEGRELELEHSLISISKWESKWRKAFLGKAEKTHEEVLDYIRCMTVTKDVDPSLYNYLTEDNLDAINRYISEPMTATRFNANAKGSRSNEVVTAEIIYYWMILHNIPPEYQNWHLNRLLTLIRVCSVKSQPSKKMSQRDIMRQQAAINASRRKAWNTRG